MVLRRPRSLIGLSMSKHGGGRLWLGEGRSFAKFVTKFAMLSIFPLREISCEI